MIVSHILWWWTSICLISPSTQVQNSCRAFFSWRFSPFYLSRSLPLLHLALLEDTWNTMLRCLHSTWRIHIDYSLSLHYYWGCCRRYLRVNFYLNYEVHNFIKHKVNAAHLIYIDYSCLHVKFRLVIINFSAHNLSFADL